MGYHSSVNTLLLFLTLASVTFAFNPRVPSLQSREPKPGGSFFKGKAESSSALPDRYPARSEQQVYTTNGQPWFGGIVVLEPTQTKVLLIKDSQNPGAGEGEWRLPQAAVTDRHPSPKLAAMNEARATAGVEGHPLDLKSLGAKEVGVEVTNYYQLVLADLPGEGKGSERWETTWATLDDAERLLVNFPEQLKMVKKSALGDPKKRAEFYSK